MITLTTADNALKSFYLDAVTEALNVKANPVLAKIGYSTNDVMGKDVKKLVKCGINGGVGAGSETGDLPASSPADSVMFTSTLKNLYGTIQITDKALRASAGNEGAFVNLLNDEMQALIKSASFNFGRMLFGDGTGVLANVVQREGETDFSVDDVSGMIEGMRVDFVNDSGVTVQSGNGVKITAIDRAQKIITLDSNDAKMSDIVRENGNKVCVQGSYGYEMTGLKAIFDSNTLYGVNRSVNPVLKPYKMANVGNISENILQIAMDKLEERSGSKVNFIVCSWGVRRSILRAFKESGIALQSMELEGGHKALSFNGIPIVADRFCPTGTLYLLNTDDFKVHQLCDWKWLEGEDGKILKQIPGKPIYTATLVKYAELMCDRPNGQGRLTDINED